MISFFNITNGVAKIGSKSHGVEWIKYEVGKEPQELLDVLFNGKKEDKINELKQAYNEVNQLDIAYMNTTFQADKDSQSLIVSVLSAGTVPTGFYWLDSLNNPVTMTYKDLQGLSATILARGQTNFGKYLGLKAQVSKATTVKDLETIVW